MQFNRKKFMRNGLVLVTLILALMSVVLMMIFNAGSAKPGEAGAITNVEPTPTPLPYTPEPELSEEAIERARNTKFDVYSPPTMWHEKEVYLTFDDGPSTDVTPRILDILKEENVKATFFVLGTEALKHPDLLLRTVTEGHKLANHSYSHVYAEIYKSKESLLNEIKKAETAINDALGFDYPTNVFRFPGGSHTRGKELRQFVVENGYNYIDWNCVGNDAMYKNGASKEVIVNSIKDTFQGHAAVTVLLHDARGKSTTADALPEIIQFFREQGYEFVTIPNW